VRLSETLNARPIDIHPAPPYPLLSPQIGTIPFFKENFTMLLQQLRFGILFAILTLASSASLLAQPPFLRTVIVNPIPGNPTGSGNRLWDRLAAIDEPSIRNPFLLKVEPGLYHLGNRTLPLRSYVDVEGSGEGVTLVFSTANTNGTVAGADACELRHLTVMNQAPTNAVGIRNLANTFSIANVMAIATGGSVSVGAIQNDGLSTRMRSVTAVANGAGATAIFSRGGTMRDIKAVADGTGIVYAIFNASSQGELIDITASATSDAFAGAIRNEGGSPTLRNLLLSANGDIGDGIVNGGGSRARIFNAVIRAVGGTSFANGIRNEFSNAVISGAEIHAEAASRAFGISNFFSGSPTLSDVRIEVTAGGGGVGILSTGTALTTVERSSVVSDGFSIEAQDALSTIRVGASRLEGGVRGAGSFICVFTYDENFTELPSGCLLLI
jgi:hypothetical protein